MLPPLLCLVLITKSVVNGNNHRLADEVTASCAGFIVGKRRRGFCVSAHLLGPGSNAGEHVIPVAAAHRSSSYTLTLGFVTGPADVPGATR